MGGALSAIQNVENKTMENTLEMPIYIKSTIKQQYQFTETTQDIRIRQMSVINGKNIRSCC